MKEIVKKYLKEYGIYIVVFLLFTYISILSPETSDDYGKYLSYGNGLIENAINSIKSYTSVNSGRFINEFFARFFVFYKPLWNIVNGIMFTSIIYLMTDKRANNKILAQLVALLGILAISDSLRMWTYTWIAGNISYIMSFLLVLVYINIIKKYLDEDRYINPVIKKPELAILIGLGIWNGFMMHNITIALFVSNIILLIYLYLKHKKWNLKILIFTISNGISTIILFLSPATDKRINGYETSELGKIELALKNIPILIKYILVENTYLIILLSIVFICLIIQTRSRKGKLNYIIDYASIIYLFWIMIDCIKGNLIGTSIVYNTQNIWSYCLWFIYFSIIFVSVFRSLRRERLALYFIIATLASGAMLFSPIVKYGTVLCTVFMFISISALVVQELETKINIKRILVAMLVFMNVIYIEKYILNYNEIHNEYQKRLDIIEKAKDEERDSIIIPGMGDKIIGGDLLNPGEKDKFKKFHKIPSRVEIIVDNGYGVQEFIYKQKEDRLYEFEIIPLNNIEQYEYAFYVYKDKKLYEKITYQVSNKIEYEMKEPGEYYIRYFLKDEKGKQAYSSPTFNVE